MKRFVLLACLGLAACSHGRENTVPKVPASADTAATRTDWLAAEFRGEVARFLPRNINVYIHAYRWDLFPPSDGIEEKLKQYKVNPAHLVVVDLNFHSEEEMRAAKQATLEYVHQLKKRFQLFSTVHGVSSWARVLFVLSHLDSIDSNVLYDESFSHTRTY